MANGIIFKALSGFYYVKSENRTVECKARGRFRREKISPLVGDNIIFSKTGETTGIIDEILPRRNVFVRPPVANIDIMLMIASAVIPVTDPFLIDRVTAISRHNNCDSIVIINKCDLDRGDYLFNLYSNAGFRTIRTSAKTGEGIGELSAVIANKICTFTGNSGVGKSSIINAIDPSFNIQIGDVSEKLGRGRHTTRHVEIFTLQNNAMVADTPGFSSFDTDLMDLVKKEDLQYAFNDFLPYINKCKYSNCAHIKEDGCAITEAVREGKIEQSRHDSYKRLFAQAKQFNEWNFR